MDTNAQQFFHLSPRKYAVGAEIRGNGKDKVDHRIEKELEARRPKGVLSRRDAVFCLEHTDFTRCGVVDAGYIYRVVPSADPQRWDFAWIGEMQKAQLRLKYPQYQKVRAYPTWSTELVSNCCSGYWAGDAFETPGWEFLMPSCTVVEVTASELIDPKRTSLGLQSSRTAE